MEIKNYFAQDAQGNIMPSANCYLYLPGTTTLATGLVDGNGIPISNPFLASGMGQITFGAPNGVYDLRVALGARDWTIKVQCADIVQAMDVMDSILGSHSENPTTRNNGQPLEPGDETWNSTDKQPYWWNGTAWVALNSSAQQLEERLGETTSASEGAGKIGNSIIVVSNVADMLALTNLAINKRIRTQGYEAPGDGGGNEYLVVASGTGTADGGSYINLTGFQAKGLFPGRKVFTKQFSAKGNNSQPSQELPIRAALATILTDSTSAAWGADVTVSLGAFKVSGGIAVAGDRKLTGTGGPNATKLIAAPDIPEGTAVISTPGAFSVIENISVHIPADVYDPATDTGKPVDGIVADNPSSFGNVYNGVRVNGGRIGFHAKLGLENKLNDSFIVGSKIGYQSDAWDSECNFTILQDCKQYCLYANGHGIESVSSHFVRAPILVKIVANGSPVHLIKPFLDTPYDIGIDFTDSRAGQIVGAYGLKIGNNANSNAVLFKLGQNSSNNFFNGGSNINTGENFAGVFQFDSTSINNKICGWHTNSKTVAFSNHSTMWKQTCWSNTGDAARYNNIPRKNRGVATNVAATATASIVLTLDYTYPALTFNTLLFYGKWVSRNSDSRGAFGDVSLPVQFGDTGCAPVMTKTSGHANNNWGVTAVSLSGNQLTVTVQNNGTATGSISIEIERSLDATGATF